LVRRHATFGVGMARLAVPAWHLKVCIMSQTSEHTPTSASGESTIHLYFRFSWPGQSIYVWTGSLAPTGNNTRIGARGP
jgi:hypothetical protein